MLNRCGSVGLKGRIRPLSVSVLFSQNNVVGEKTFLFPLHAEACLQKTFAFLSPTKTITKNSIKQFVKTLTSTRNYFKQINDYTIGGCDGMSFSCFSYSQNTSPTHEKNASNLPLNYLYFDFVCDNC
jgi:hypothetical protein